MKPTFSLTGSVLFLLCLSACASIPGSVDSSPVSTDSFSTILTTPNASPLPASPTPLFTDTLTDTPTPTFSPTATKTATSTPSKTLGDGWPTSEETVSVNPCQNVLYPLAAGHQWTYAVTNGHDTNTAIVSVKTIQGNTASMEILNQGDGLQYSFTIQCSQGALTGLSAVEIGFLFFSSDTFLMIRTTSGIVAPSQQELENNNWALSWETDILASGQMRLNNPTSPLTDLAFENSPVQIVWNTAESGTAAFESVESHAGTFSNALKVTARARFDLTVKVHAGSQDQLVPAVLELEASLWYQPNVGLVKQVFTSSEISSMGFSSPLTFPSQMELWEYNFAS